MEMNKTQIEELRTSLGARAAVLRSAIGPAFPSLITEGDSRSPEELEHDPPGADAKLAIDAVHCEELRDVEAAMARLVQGTYGTCTDCGLGIPYSRLAAFPTAKRCLTCQGRYEQRQRVVGRTA